MALILPEHYDPKLTVRETQDAIKYIRDTFQKEFGHGEYRIWIAVLCSISTVSMYMCIDETGDCEKS